MVLTSVTSLSDSVSHDNAGVGMILTTGVATVVENNVVYANAGDGMQVTNFNPAVTVRVGNADLLLARGNRVFGNAGHGIVARAGRRWPETWCSDKTRPDVLESRSVAGKALKSSAMWYMETTTVSSARART